jgi:hypothetical protein
MSSILLPGRYAPVPEGVVERAALIRALGFMPPEQAAQFDALLDASYVLVRNDGAERARCNPRRGGCNAIHAHFTYLCIPRPFRGLHEGLYAYWANVGQRRDDELTAEQRSRLQSLGPLFTKSAPLATVHPRTARELGTRQDDVDLGAVLLGTLDPISPLQARLYAEQINMKARRTVVRL